MVVLAILLGLAVLLLVIASILPWGFRVKFHSKEKWSWETRIFLRYWPKLGIAVNSRTQPPPRSRIVPGRGKSFFNRHWRDITSDAWANRDMLLKYFYAFRRELHWRGMEGEMVFGTGEPATTGMLYGLWLFLGRPMLGKKLKVSASFWSRCFQLEAAGEGYFIPFSILKTALTAFGDRKLRHGMWRWFKRYREEAKSSVERKPGGDICAPGKTFYH